MLNDNQFISESLITNLYYLRTLREYCTRIQVSFQKKAEEYVKKSEELAIRCEEIGNRLVELSDGNIPEDALKSDFIVTQYTLEAEKLTEKLFDVNIKTEITERELNIKPGTPNATPELILEIENINKEIIDLAKDFVEFATSIQNKVKNQEIFTFYYNSLNSYMIEEIRIYIFVLERLNQKLTLDPSFISDNEFWRNSFLYGVATFIRGEIDPLYDNIFKEANNFVLEYKNIVLEYENMQITPETQRNMTLNSLELSERFKLFIEKCLEKLLKKELYFISAPITKDNALTAVNYFIYILKKYQNIIVE